MIFCQELKKIAAKLPIKARNCYPMSCLSFSLKKIFAELHKFVAELLLETQN